MPTHSLTVTKKRVGNILHVTLSGALLKVDKPDFKEDAHCFTGIKANNESIRDAYKAIAGKAKDQHIPMRVSELAGDGSIKIFTVFVSPRITPDQIDALKLIAEEEFKTHGKHHGRIH